MTAESHYLSNPCTKFKDFSISGTQDLDEYRQYQQFGNGRRTGMTDSTGATAWVYNRRGQVSQEKKTVGSDVFSTLWSYNAAGQPATMTYPADNQGRVDEQVVFGYHPQGLLNSLVGTSTYVQDTTYDAAGRVGMRTLGSNTLKTGYEYFPWTSQGGRLKFIRTGTPIDIESLLKLEYAYDATGNVDWIKDWKLGSPQIHEFGVYDGLDRLTSAYASGGTNGQGNYASAGNPELYAYDAATGNLSSKAGLTYTYGTQSASCPGGALSKPHAVVSAGSNVYCYDANGNQVRRTIGGTVYNLSYDEENRLTDISGGTTASFVYDGDGARVKGISGFFES